MHILDFSGFHYLKLLSVQSFKTVTVVLMSFAPANNLNKKLTLSGLLSFSIKEPISMVYLGFCFNIKPSIKK